MKKLIAFLLCLICIFGCACGESPATPTDLIEDYIEIEDDDFGCIDPDLIHRPVFLQWLKEPTYIGEEVTLVAILIDFLPLLCYFISLKEMGVTMGKAILNITIDGKCVVTNTFTPDDQYCYKCNDLYVGMPGCKGPCSYSKDGIVNPLKCEGECKNDYIESSKGICEPCNIINKGCVNCSYSNSYKNDYIGFRRGRRFVCHECEDGFIKGSDDLCHHCMELGFKNCDSCHYNNDNEEYEYTKCIDGYFMTDNNFCIKCEEPKVQGLNNRCICCNDDKEGGIEGCEECFSNNGDITCNKCKRGYILEENSQKCLNVSKEGLEYLTNCLKVSKISAHNYICSECSDNYILLKDKKQTKCVNHNFIYSRKPENVKFCKVAINNGTSEERPIHSCEKCKSNKMLSQEQRENGITITRIFDSDSKQYFCQFSEGIALLENCTEAIRHINEYGEEIFNCTNYEEDNNF